MISMGYMTSNFFASTCPPLPTPLVLLLPFSASSQASRSLRMLPLGSLPQILASSPIVTSPAG